MFMNALSKDRRGTVAVILAGCAIPLLLGVGVAVDMARLSMARTMLQSAADDAALAGAAAYQTSGQLANAQTVATNYFNAATAGQSSLLTNITVSALAAPGTYTGTIASNNVTVTASAKMPTTFLVLGGISSVSIPTASATAANPWTQATSTTTWQPVISSGFLGSSAWDWNSVYMYAVPMVNGVPNYSSYPPISQFYEIASNCSAATNSAWSANSPCNAWTGAVVPTTQTFPPVAANQPLAFVLFNMTGGVGGNYGANQYGSAYGNMRLSVTAALTYGLGPAALDDSPRSYINTMFGTAAPNSASRTDATTHYSDVNNSATPNCALLIQVIDPKNPPTSAPVTAGSCYALNSTTANLQLANLTCAQIAGRTLVYWWNDMGGGTDDKDYNDMVFSITCVPPPANVNGGNLYSGTQAGTKTTVSLIK